jgi:hypothetical protein
MSARQAPTTDVRHQTSIQKWFPSPDGLFTIDIDDEDEQAVALWCAVIRGCYWQQIDVCLIISKAQKWLKLSLFVSTLIFAKKAGFQKLQVAFNSLTLINKI